MDTHHIHGTKIDFHGETESAKEFLEKNPNATKEYLESAKHHGEVHFTDGKGNKFKMEHSGGEGDKDNFFIRRSEY